MASIQIRTILDASPQFPRHDSATVVELTGGRLMLAWMEHVGGDEIGHDHSLCNIGSMVSCDGGTTWADRKILVENAPGDVNIHYPCFLRLQSGEILFHYVRQHELKPAEPMKLSTLLCRSTDECETFSEPITLDCRGRPLSQLSTGRVIIPSQKQLGTWCGPEDRQLAGCYYSDDAGHSWTQSAGWVDLPLRGAMEPHIAELRDGRLLMVMRTQLGAIFQSESADGGDTWSKPQTTCLRGPESMRCLVRVPRNGDLLLIWNNSEYDPQFDHFGKRTPLTVALSKDDGQTWENRKDLETDPTVEFTNPSCHFTSDGKVLITYMASPMDNPDPPGQLGRSHMPLKLAIADLEWFYQS